MQTAMVKEIVAEHLTAGAERLLTAAPASTTAAKQQLLGLLNGMLYTIIGLGSTLAGDWPRDAGQWAVIGKVHTLVPAGIKNGRVAGCCCDLRVGLELAVSACHAQGRSQGGPDGARPLSLEQACIVCMSTQQLARLVCSAHCGSETHLRVNSHSLHHCAGPG